MKIKLAHPLISCICITNNRPSMLLKAIFSFICQNYPNRELLISYPKGDSSSKEIVSKVSAHSTLEMISLERDENQSLGQARNHAVANCNGEYICMWDDDDLYHFDRVMHQFNDMQGKYVEAGVLTNIFIYDSANQKAYLSASHNWTGTLLCRKDLILKHPYSDSNLLEDTNLLKYLESSKLLHKISDSAYLYTFVYHSENTLDNFYLQYLIRSSRALDDSIRNFLRQQFEVQLISD